MWSFQNPTPKHSSDGQVSGNLPSSVQLHNVGSQEDGKVYDCQKDNGAVYLQKIKDLYELDNERQIGR